VGNNFTLTVPPTGIVLTQTAGATALSPAGTNSYNLNIPPVITPTVNGGGVLTVAPSTTGNNFTLSVPGTSVTMTQSVGATTVSTAGTNSFNINVTPPITPTINGGGVLTVAPSTTGNNFTLSVPGTSITQGGAVVVTPAGTNSFNVSVPVTSVVVTSTPGVVGYNSTGTNSVTINVPPAITPTINATGLAIATSTGNAFTIDVPVLTYTAATAGLGSGTNTLSIQQNLTISGTTLTSGPASNSVNLNAVGPWRQATGAVTLSTASDKVGIGGNAPVENLQVESAGSTSVSVLSGATGTSEISMGTLASHTNARIRFDNTLGTMSFWTNGVSDRLFIENGGNIAMGQNFAVAKLDVNGNIRIQNKIFLGGVGGINSGYTGLYENGGDIRFAVVRSGASATPFGTSNSYDAMTIDSPSGRVGIGTTAPAEDVHIESTTSASLSIVSTSGSSDLLMGSPATHGLGRIRFTPSSNDMSFWTSSTQRMNINNTGQVFIGTPAAAVGALNVGMSGAFNNQIIVSGGDNTNT
jgi:hypothetical protein